jgi:hypothetical protein
VRSTNGQQVYVTILNIPDHQGNANANHDKMSSPPKSDFYQQHSGDVGKRNLHTVGGM